MTRGVRSVLLWIVLAAVVGVMGFAMLEACGLRIPGGPVLVELCAPATAAPNAALRAEKRRGETLEQQIVQLERQLAQAPDCSSQ